MFALQAVRVVRAVALGADVQVVVVVGTVSLGVQVLVDDLARAPVLTHALVVAGHHWGQERKLKCSLSVAFSLYNLPQPTIHSIQFNRTNFNPEVRPV